MTTQATVEATLRTIERALSQEAHVLATWPNLAWQQLHNRLQWSDRQPIERLAAFAERRRASPWLRSMSPPTESAALVRTLVGHTKAVTACAFSGDGRLVVSASDDKTVRVWDRETGAERLTLQSHKRQVLACAFSPDGDRIVSAGEDLVKKPRRSRETKSAEAVKLWDTHTGAVLHTIQGHVPTGGRSNVFVRDCTFSPDGRWIASAGSDNSLRIWDAETGEEIMSLDDHPASVVSCAFSPTGRCAVAATEGGRAGKQRQPAVLKIWDMTTGQEIRSLAGQSHGVNACAFSPDGRHVIAAGLDLVEVEDQPDKKKAQLLATVKVWDAHTGEEVGNLLGGAGRGERDWPSATDCAWSPDAAHIAAANRDGTLTLWRAESGEEVGSLAGHSGRVNACTFSPDGQVLVSGGSDTTLKLWDVTPAAAQRSAVDRHDGSVHSCEFGLGGRRVLSAARGDPVVLLWDDQGVLVEELAGHTREIDSVALSPDGLSAVSSGWDGTLRIWDLETGAETGSVERPVGSGKSGGCSFSPDGRQIVFFGYGDKSLRVFAADSGGELEALAQHTVRIRAFAFRPDGQRIVTTGEDKTADGKLVHTVRVWDAGTGDALLELGDHTGDVTGCSYSPDGRYVITTSRKPFHGGDVAIWDAATGDRLSSLFDGRKASATSPDGRTIASFRRSGLHEGRTLTLWDLASGAELATHRGFSAGPCVFSPDGQLLLAARPDRSLAVLEAENGTEIARLPDAGARSLSMHPSTTRFAFGDEVGGVRFFDMVGIDCGPIIVTAVDLGNGLEIRCPHCNQTKPFDDDWRGKDIDCPGPDCGGSLRINPFVVGEDAAETWAEV